jgi:hypothetical protein
MVLHGLATQLPCDAAPENAANPEGRTGHVENIEKRVQQHGGNAVIEYRILESKESSEEYFF